MISGVIFSWLELGLGSTFPGTYEFSGRRVILLPLFQVAIVLARLSRDVFPLSAGQCRIHKHSIRPTHSNLARSNNIIMHEY